MQVIHNNQQYKVSRLGPDEWRLTSVEKPRESITMSAQHMNVAGFQQFTNAPVTDLARQPAQQQAVRLNWFEAVLRRICYLLAQKGDPDA